MTGVGIGGGFIVDRFHDVAVPQIGPGEGNGPSMHDDFGHMNATGDPKDLCRFRTSPLRNLMPTGPWGRDGAFASLREFIPDHSPCDLALRNWPAGPGYHSSCSFTTPAMPDR